MDEILQILEEIVPDVDFEKETNLVENGIFSSMNIVVLVCKLSEHYKIEIGPENLIPENFYNASAIWAMVQRIQTKK